MNVRQKLTLNPETQAGQELLSLSKELLKLNLLNKQIIDNLSSEFERTNIMNLLVKKVLMLKLVKFDLHMQD